MKRITLLSLAVLVAASVFSQKPYTQESNETKALDHYLSMRKTNNTMQNVKLASDNSKAKSQSRKLNTSAIKDQPSGELMLMRRSGTDWLPVWGSPAPADYTEKGTYVVKGDDGCYYFKNIVTNMCNGGTWVKGTVNAGIINIPVGQVSALVEDWGDNHETFTYYLWAMKAVETTGTDWEGNEYTYTTYEVDEEVDNIQLKLETNGTITSIDPDLMIGATESDFVWLGYGDVNSTFYPFNETPQTAPETANFSDYVFINKPYLSNDAYAIVNIAVEGNDVYIKNLLKMMPEGVIKATISGNKATLKTNQFIGVENTYSTLCFIKASDPELFDDNGWPTIYDHEIEELVFDYNADQKRFENQTGGFVLNAGSGDISTHENYYHPVFYKFEEKSVEPAPIEFTSYLPYTESDWGAWGYAGFNMYTKDVEGNYILPEKLFYTCYLDETPLVFAADAYDDLTEDMSVVPYYYNNSDIVASSELHYIYFHSGDFERFGVQAIYRGAGDEKRSPIVYYQENDPESVEGVTNSQSVVNVIYTDLSGRRHNGLTKGLNIVTMRYADGSIKTTKLFVK